MFYHSDQKENAYTLLPYNINLGFEFLSPNTCEHYIGAINNLSRFLSMLSSHHSCLSRALSRNFGRVHEWRMADGSDYGVNSQSTAHSMSKSSLGDPRTSLNRRMSVLVSQEQRKHQSEFYCMAAANTITKNNSEKKGFIWLTLQDHSASLRRTPSETWSKHHGRM